MAKWNHSDPKQATEVTIQKGDTLWAIAKAKYCSGIKYKQIAALNNLSNPNLIAIGTTLKLDSSGSSSSSSTKTTNSNKPTIDQFGVLSTDENTLFATWTWSKSNTESYKVLWTYDTGDGVWFSGNNSTITVDEDAASLSRQSTYSIPSGAKRVQFKVKPISKTYKKNNTDTHYWEAEWSTVKTWTDSTPLDTPDTPSIKIEKYKLTTSLENIKITDATGIEFQIVKMNSNGVPKTFKTGKATISSAHASYSCNVDAGGEYKVRCRAYKGSSYSDWTAYSSSAKTMPAAPSGITSIKAASETSVYLKWASVSSAESYDIEYATKKEYFDYTDQTTTKNGIEVTQFTIEGLETGHEYFFRVRAVNTEGESAWSEIKSVSIGSEPIAPTTWSSTTTAIVGEELNLYWVHNAEDASTQTFVQLKIWIDGVEQADYTFADTAKNDGFISYTPLTEDEKEEGKANSVSVNTSTYSEGTKLEWQVATAGVTNKLGDWSVKRTVDIYAPPTLELDLTDKDTNTLTEITSFPFYIRGLAGPNTQAPIGYQLTITSNSTYDTTDNMGNTKTVTTGEQVYSKYFDTTQALLVEFWAGNIDLENNITYTVTCTVSMNSGLTAESSLEFTVAWEDMEYEPNAEIGIDPDTFTAYIRPYCEDGKLVCHAVTHDSGVYTIGDEYADAVYGEPYRECREVIVNDGMYEVGETDLFGLVIGDPVSGVKITTGEQVYYGTNTETEEQVYYCYLTETPAVTETGEEVYRGSTIDGTDMYYCYVETKTLIDNVYLSVYRREFDGSFTEIATELDGALSTTVTDPHPALDFARYRIVAISKDNGSVSFYDPPGYPVGGKAAIIQWDEEWSSFEVAEDEVLEEPPWSGSMLQLMYNIDVSDSNNPDVELVEYVGREHPVTYHGTHLGHTASWNMEIEKSDKETLYALRRLQRWMGDAYVREPSGSGYWANVKVSFSQKHCEVTIPVTLSITRVEGGM